MRFRTLPLVVAGLLSLVHLTSDAAIVPESLSGFPVGPGAPNSGNTSPLYHHSDGSFIGMSPGGGAFNLGTVFQLTSGGQINWLSLSGNEGSAPGASPTGGLVRSTDGWLWGTTTQGGASSTGGTIFRIKPETGEHQVVRNMNMVFPGMSGLTPDGTGWLWGSVANGGTSQRGLIYRIHEGTGQFEVKLANFGGASAPKGQGPGELYFDGTYFWGITGTGGSGGRGTVFRIRASDSAFTTMGEFADNTPNNGWFPGGKLTPDGNGYLWGVTNSGQGTITGSIFKVNMAGSDATATTTVYQFSSATGTKPLPPLASDGAGNLWGVTNQGGTGNMGTVFKIKTSDNALTTVVHFSTLTGVNANVTLPANALVNDGEGFMWGLTSLNGTNSRWNVYKVEMATGNLTKVAGYKDAATPLGSGLKSKLIGRPGSDWLYGTTQTGGAFDSGTLYRFHTVSGKIETLVNFTGNSGAAPGANPSEQLLIYSDGVIWGTTRLGGTGGGGGSHGTVFKYDPVSATFTNLINFANNVTPRGSQPHGNLILGADGMIWGVTGLIDDGTVFKINPATGALNTVKLFAGANHVDGSRPFGLTADDEGTLWGITSRGGAVPGSITGYGTIFKIDQGTGSFVSVLKFTGPSGAQPGTTPTGAFTLFEGQLWTHVNEGLIILDPLTSQVTTMPLASATTEQIEAGYGGPAYTHHDGMMYFATQNAGTDKNGVHMGAGVIQRSNPDQIVPTTNAPYLPGNDAYPTQARDFIQPFDNGFGSIAQNGNSGTYQIEWGSSNAVTRSTSPVAVPASPSPVGITTQLPALSGDTSYYFRVRVNGPNGPVYGRVESFYTRVYNLDPSNPEIMVDSPLGQPLLDNQTTVALGGVLVGESRMQGVVIKNIGIPTLTGLTAVVSGVDAAKFVITTPLGATTASSTAPTSLFFTYTPTDAGTDSALLTITSNDSDEGTFEIPLSGEGLIQPEIVIEQPAGTELGTDGTATVDFGSHDLGVEATREFTVRNIGNGLLTNLNVTIEGINGADFELLPGSLADVAVNGDTTFTIAFTASGGGIHQAVMHITSNDPDEEDIEIILTGTGTGAPEIVVEYPAFVSMISGNNTVPFGEVLFGGSATRTITIRNTGATPLTGISAAVQGQFQYQVTTNPIGTLQPGASTSFVVTYTPVGPYALATMHITSNDANESPFIVGLSGSGISASEIAVLDDETPLTDGVGTRALGNVPAGALATKTFTIRNFGNVNLTGISASFAAGAGTGYAITTSPAASLAPQGTTQVVVTFTSNALGAQTATLLIASNDANENPFDIALSATGTAAAVPAFSSQPESLLLAVGARAEFTPSVSSTPGTTYQWKKNGTAIANAKSTTYTIAATKATDVGTFTLTATNALGPNTSNNAYLGLVTLKPGSFTFKEAPTSTLNLTCTAAAPTATGVSLSYEWRRNNVALPNELRITGKTSSALKITSLVAADSGTYTCMVTMTMPDGTLQRSNGDTVVTVVKKPTIAPIVLSNASVGETINVTITSDFAAKFTATGLPPGVVLNGTTGVLSGKPTAAKIVSGNVVPYVVKFTASNLGGTSDVVTVNWTIEALDPSLIGTFNGLVDRNAFTNFGFGGTVQITTTAKGAITGSITLAGQKYPLTGVLEASIGNNPSAALVVKRTPASLGDLKLTIDAVEMDDDRLSGTIRDEQFAVMVGEMAIGNGEAGSAGGTFEEARLNGPRGIALVGEGGYIADTGNHVIRIAGETVDIFAGADGSSGSANGTGGEARFNLPEGLAVDAAGNLYVADTGNGSIRKITPAGVVTTLAAPAGTFVSPCALAFDDKGNLVVVDRGNHTLKKISPSGVITTLAGKVGISGHKDATGTAALFKGPRGITFDAKLKAFFVADTGNRVIRKVTPTGTVSTYAGSPGVEGYASGLAANARFIAPTGIASDGNGNLVVADTLLIQISPGGIVATISEYVDASGNADHPVAVVIDGDGGIVVADAGLHAITSYEEGPPGSGTPFVALRNTWTTAAPVPAARVGNYTAGIATGQEGEAEFPQGQGYATLTVTKLGVATWGGKAADGSTLTCATTVGPEGEVLLHTMLYKNTGSLQGLTTINPDNGDWVSGLVTPLGWYKVAQPTTVVDRAYKSGFILHQVTLAGGPYTPANQVFAFLNITPATTTANATATFSEGGLTGPFSQVLDIKTPSTVTVPTTGNPNTVKLTVTGSSGVFTGSFNQGTRKATVAGVLTRNTAGAFRQGRGYFLLPQDTTTTGPQLSGEVIIEAD